MSDQGYRTPPWLIAALEDFFGQKFALDAAATADNAKAAKFYDLHTDGLAQPWVEMTFCNPPFADFGTWITKAYVEAKEQNINVCVLGPVGCSQRWFHRIAKKGTVLVPTKRINYYSSITNKPTSGADRDSHIFLFGPKWWNTSLHWNLVPFDVDNWRNNE